MFFKALLAYRSTPLDTGMSPAELLMGRRLRGSLPLHSSLLQKEEMEAVIDRKVELKKKQASYHNQQTRPLTQIEQNTKVVIQDQTTKEWTRQGSVAQQVAPRSYEVNTDKGTLRRNRKHLKVAANDEPTSTTPQSDEPLCHMTALPHCHDQDMAVESTVIPQEPGQPQSNVVPRASGRVRHPPRRLVDEL